MLREEVELLLDNKISQMKEEICLEVTNTVIEVVVNKLTNMKNEMTTDIKNAISTQMCDVLNEKLKCLNNIPGYKDDKTDDKTDASVATPTPEKIASPVDEDEVMEITPPSKKRESSPGRDKPNINPSKKKVTSRGTVTRKA